MLHAYYKLRGWNTDGIPTAETLVRLGIERD
jgi:aldehyde:ferredoxin oxidoreductase